MRSFLLWSATGCFLLAICLGGPGTAFTAVQRIGGDEKSVFGRQTLAADEITKDYLQAADDGSREIFARIAEHLQECEPLPAHQVEKERGASHRLLLPNRMRNVLPAAVHTDIEHNADQGVTPQEMSQEYGDRHLLHPCFNSDDRKLTLRFAASSPSLMCGTRMRVLLNRSRLCHGLFGGDLDGGQFGLCRD